MVVAKQETFCGRSNNDITLPPCRNIISNEWYHIGGSRLVYCPAIFPVEFTFVEFSTLNGKHLTI